MKYLSFFLILLFSSCINTHTREVNPIDSSSEFAIKPCVKEALSNYITFIDNNISGFNADTDIIFIIDFWNQYPSMARPFDTIVVFDYYVKDDLMRGYKGCTMIDGYLVAIKDEQGIGTNYYVEDSLLHIPIKYLKPFENENYSQIWGNETLVQLLVPDHGKLKTI